VRGELAEENKKKVEAGEVREIFKAVGGSLEAGRAKREEILSALF
jgi:hypothetical protein